MKNYSYDNFEDWIAEWDTDEMFYDSEDLENLQLLMMEFNNGLTNKAMKLLGEYLSGCGGTEHFMIISEHEYQSLKALDNTAAIAWLKDKAKINEIHHSEDPTDVQCCLYKIGPHYLFNSFMPG